MDDMKWLGEPVDVAGSFQKGMNLSGQYQKMKQSGEMHPLRKEAARADTAYKTGQTSLAKQREGQLDKMNPLLVTQQQTTNAIREQEKIKSEAANDFWGTVKGHATSLYKSKAGAAATGAELAAGTLKANIERGKAESREAESAARVALGTEEAKTKTIIAQATILGNRAELDSYSLIHNKTRADLALYSAWNGLDREGQDLQRGWLGLKEIRKDIEKDAASDFDFQVDYGAMNTFARNGDVDGLETHELGSNLSDAQRKTLESHRTQLQGQHAIETQRLIQQRGEVGQVLSDNKAMGDIQEVKNHVHRQWFLNQNSQSWTGAAIYDPSTGKLTNDGLVALTNYTQYEATTLTADELAEIKYDLQSKGIDPGYDAVAGGDQFIPSKEMLNAMAVKTSANLTAERARFGANRTAEWQTQSGMTVKGEAVSKMDADVFKAKLTHINTTVKSLLEEGDMTVGEAFTEALSEAGVVGGEIQAIEGASDLEAKLKSGKLKGGDLYLDMTAGAWKHAPSPVAAGGAPGGGAPGGATPATATGQAQLKDLERMGVNAKDQSDMKGFIARMRGEKLEYYENELSNMTATELLKEYQKSNGLRMMEIEEEVKELLPGMPLDPNETAMVQVMRQLQEVVKDWEGGKKPEELRRFIEYTGKSWIGRKTMTGRLGSQGEGVKFNTGLLTKLKSHVEGWNERARYTDWATEKLRK
jgi:hypothetical protein